MKASKVLKRLARIEASIAHLTERYSGSEIGIKQALEDISAAANRAKSAVGLLVPSEAEQHPVENSTGPGPEALDANKKRQRPAKTPATKGYWKTAGADAAKKRKSKSSAVKAKAKKK